MNRSLSLQVPRIEVQFVFEEFSTALHLAFEVASLNLRHFQRIPGLSMIQLGSMPAPPARENRHLGHIADFSSETCVDKFWIGTFDYNRITVRIFLSPLWTSLNSNCGAKNAIDQRPFPLLHKYTVPTAN